MSVTVTAAQRASFKWRRDPYQWHATIWGGRDALDAVDYAVYAAVAIHVAADEVQPGCHFDLHWYVRLTHYAYCEVSKLGNAPSQSRRLFVGSLPFGYSLSQIAGVLQAATGQAIYAASEIRRNRNPSTAIDAASEVRPKWNPSTACYIFVDECAVPHFTALDNLAILGPRGLYVHHTDCPLYAREGFLAAIELRNEAIGELRRRLGLSGKRMPMRPLVVELA